MGSIVTKKVKLLVALLALPFCHAGFHIVSRLELNIGVSKVVYPVYRNLIALILLSPFAYLLENWVSIWSLFSLSIFLSHSFCYCLWNVFSKCYIYFVIRNQRPPFSVSLLVQFFLLALLGQASILSADLRSLISFLLVPIVSFFCIFHWLL